MLSSACQDTIRAAIWLSVQPEGGYFRIAHISEALNLPYHFLAKSLQKLVHAGILTSFRGANGGVKLSKNANEISLLSIIDAIDGERVFDQCILGFGECEAEKPCSLHSQWEKWRLEMHDMYEAMRLSEITDDVLQRRIKRI